MSVKGQISLRVNRLYDTVFVYRNGLFPRPPTKLREGNVFSRVRLSGGEGKG